MDKPLPGYFKVKALHYTSDQIRILQRTETLWVEPPPEDFRPQLQYFLSKSKGDIPNFLANLLCLSDKYLESFTEFSYETQPGGSVRHTHVKTYIFIFTRQTNKDGVVEEFTLKKEFV